MLPSHECDTCSIVFINADQNAPDDVVSQSHDERFCGLEDLHLSTILREVVIIDLIATQSDHSAITFDRIDQFAKDEICVGQLMRIRTRRRKTDSVHQGDGSVRGWGHEMVDGSVGTRWQKKGGGSYGYDPALWKG